MVNDDEMKEKDAINELKKRMIGEMDSEMYEDESVFYRFLKAQDFNINSGEVMLRKHLEWRKKYDVANITTYQECEVLKNHFPFVMIGYDKEGSIVRYSPFGSVDWIGIFLSSKTDDWLKRLISDIEEDVRELKRQSEKLGKTIDKTVYIFNLENFGFAEATNKKAALNMIFACDMYQSNYPERLKAIYIINASIYYTLMFSIVKNFMANTVLSKMKIYSDDSYKEDLLKIIDADVLPEFLGGNRSDPNGDPSCPSLLQRIKVSPVPETYYIHKSKRAFATLPDVEKVTLTRANFHEVFLDVKDPGSYLEWEFEIKCRDVGFGLFYREMIDGEEKLKELVPLQKTDTEEYSAHGIYKCEEAGTYVMVFDNTHSWLRAKEIYYKVKVVTPEEQEVNLKK